MICQDDNFTAFTRAYGKLGLDIAAVPTLDWYQVKDAHFQSSVSRAIECRYAVVRAATDGISAVISAKGKVLAKMDHFKDGPGCVVAEVGIYDTVTLYSILGDKTMIGLGAVYLAGFIGFSIAAGKYKKDVKIANAAITSMARDDSKMKVDEKVVSEV
jgi:apolipoprotein N-acyltransferase